MAKTKWDPYSGAPPPPPPPPKSLVNQNTKPAFLPPPSRTSSIGSRSLSTSSTSTASSAPPLPSRDLSSSTPPLPSRGLSSAPPPPPPRAKVVAPVPPAIHLSSSQPNPPITNAPPPPIVRSTRPDLHSRPIISQPPTPPSETEIDWSNLSPEDKHIFFGWLDEFFANFTPPGPRDAAVAHHPPVADLSHAPPLQSSVSTFRLKYITAHTHPNDETQYLDLQTKPMPRNRTPVGST